MTHLVEIIDSYIATSQTDFAVLINGAWGSGKTHFLKNNIYPVLKTKGFTPVYVSLYGISSTEEIARRLFLESNPLLKKVLERKNVKRVTEVVKALIGGASFHGINLKPPFFKPDTWLNIDTKLILCFDDLERVKLSLVEVLGYINNFIEHDACKVLIIANENELPTMDSNYEIYKEKIVGRTVEYKPNLDNVLDSMIRDYEAQIEFKQFLTEQKSFLKDFVTRTGNFNLRILKHALIYFSNIFIVLRSLQEKLAQAQETELFYFSLTVSYAMGDKDAKDLGKDLLRLSSTVSLMMAISSNPRADRERTVIERYYDKYYKAARVDLLYSAAIARYLISGFFDRDLLVKEFTPETAEDNDPRVILTRQIMGHWYELSDTEFIDISSQLLEFITRGKIRIGMYTRLFEYYEMFVNEGIIPEKIGSIFARFKDGLSAACSTSTIFDLDDMPHMTSEAPSELLKEILQLKAQCYDVIRKRHFVTEASKVFALFPQDIQLWASSLLDSNSDKDHRLYREPVFGYYNPQKLFKRMEMAQNKDLVNFRRVIDSRYKSIGNISDSLRGDYDNLQSLRELLKTYHDTLGLSLRAKLILNIVTTLDECLALLKGPDNKGSAVEVT